MGSKNLLNLMVFCFDILSVDNIYQEHCFYKCFIWDYREEQEAQGNSLMIDKRIGIQSNKTKQKTFPNAPGGNPVTFLLTTTEVIAFVAFQYEGNLPLHSQFD